MNDGGTDAKGFGDASRRAERLVEELKRYNDLYYRHGVSAVDDFTYDAVVGGAVSFPSTCGFADAAGGR